MSSNRAGMLTELDTSIHTETHSKPVSDFQNFTSAATFLILFFSMSFFSIFSEVVQHSLGLSSEPADGTLGPEHYIKFLLEQKDCTTDCTWWTDVEEYDTSSKAISRTNVILTSQVFTGFPAIFRANLPCCSPDVYQNRLNILSLHWSGM